MSSDQVKVGAKVFYVCARMHIFCVDTFFLFVPDPGRPGEEGARQNGLCVGDGAQPAAPRSTSFRQARPQPPPPTLLPLAGPEGHLPTGINI